MFVHQEGCGTTSHKHAAPDHNQLLGSASPAAPQACPECDVGVTHNAEVAVGVMGIMLQITSTIYMSGLALSTSANTNISNALGAGHGAAARLSFWTSAGTVVVVQAAWTLACLIWQRQVMGVMSSSGEVVELALKTLPIMAPTFISECVYCRQYRIA